MNNKTLAWTVVILGALSAALHVAKRPPPLPPADPRVGQCIVDRAGLERAAEIRISDAGGTSVRLLRQADGVWRLDGPQGPRADLRKLSQFVQDLARSRVTRLVTASPDRLAALDFTRTGIALGDGQGHAFWSISLGRLSDLGGRYVRFGDEGKAYLARIEAVLDAGRVHWIASEPPTTPER